MPYSWLLHVQSYKVRLPRCFHLSTFLSFFPPLCAVVKNSDCEKYPLFALGQWELKRVCIDVLDSGRSPMLFFFFLFRKWKIFFPQKEYRQFFLTTWHFVTKFVCYWIQVIKINFQLLMQVVVLTCTWCHNSNKRYSWCIFIVCKFVWFSLWRSSSFNKCEFWWVIAVATALKKSISEPTALLF
jgi:hypothetical protein